MAKNDYIEFEGEVTQVYPGGKFGVILDNNGQKTREILAHISGRMRLNKINILLGDKVTVEVSPYDISQGRITYRHK